MILAYPNKRLRTPADPIHRLDVYHADVKLVIERMIQIMYLSDGMGLAATQIGENRRIFVFDSDGNPEVVINPEIISKEGESADNEACLSVPFFASKIKRATKIYVKYLNEEGLEVLRHVEGSLARVFQHEIDHLDGVLILDHVSQFHREKYRNKLKKMLRRMKRRG